MAGNLLSNLLKCKIRSTDRRHFEVEAEIPRFGVDLLRSIILSELLQLASHGSWRDEKNTFQSITKWEIFHRASIEC